MLANVPRGEKGRDSPTATMRPVSNKTVAAAVFCKYGIFYVRIICTITVCDSRPSINHPE
jgi:hypothetical protein